MQHGDLAQTSDMTLTHEEAIQPDAELGHAVSPEACRDCCSVAFVRKLTVCPLRDLTVFDQIIITPASRHVIFVDLAVHQCLLALRPIPPISSDLDEPSDVYGHQPERRRMNCESSAFHWLPLVLRLSLMRRDVGRVSFS